MKYYDEEILSIPARVTYDAIMESGIYECPQDYPSRKRSLFISFRRDNGRMYRLFKLTDVFELDINDATAIAVIESSVPGFSNRLSKYKQILLTKHNEHVSGKKRVYVLDIEHPIVLPVPVRPVENNAPPVYYGLHEFFSNVNSNIDSIIVQKDISILGDKLTIHTNGKKTYELFDVTGSSLKVFNTNDSYSPLLENMAYSIQVRGTNRRVALKIIRLNYINNQWVEYYEF